MEFYTDNIQIAYAKTTIVDNLSFVVPPGKITALVGANGSGKSTILKAMCRIMKPAKGEVILDGRSIHRHATREIAQHLTILPQNPESPGELTVEELVAYGRSPYRRGFARMSKEDQEKISWALAVTGMEALAESPMDQLSGGQRQRAWIAMSVAQDTEILFLDEPTTFLDMSHQLEVLELLKSLNRDHGKTIVMIVHDLNQAARYAHHIVAIKRGKILYQGTPRDVITTEACMQIFGVRADIIYDRHGDVPLCMPYAIC